jgi:hypothetical protein
MRDCIEAGVLREKLVAIVRWATVHGVVSLELAGGLRTADPETVFGAATRTVAAGFAGGAPPKDASPAS